MDAAALAGMLIRNGGRFAGDGKDPEAEKRTLCMEVPGFFHAN
jgi:hypothetical protein